MSDYGYDPYEAEDIPPRQKIWLITAGAYLAGGVALVIPVDWTQFHSETPLRIFGYLELAIGVIGTVIGVSIMLRKKRNG